MEQAIQIYAIVHLTVIGISHVMQPRAWVSFIAFLRERGEAGVFAHAFISLMFGSIVVAFHNVWTGLPMVLTILGWSQVLKALLYFSFPAIGLRGLQIPTEERTYVFIYPGVLLLLVAALLGYHLWVT